GKREEAGQVAGERRAHRLGHRQQAGRRRQEEVQSELRQYGRPPSRSRPMPLARRLSPVPALVLALAASCGPALADEADAPKSPSELLAASQPSDWRTLDPENTLYMRIPSGQVVIELAPQFAPAHVANIRTLARVHYWDGLSIYRSQDN